jgi:hypothetical protein
MLKALRGVISAFFRWLQVAYGYISFTATALTAISLIFRREFTQAILISIESALPVGALLDFLRTIVTTWHGLVVEPVAQIITDFTGWEPSLFIVEVATLCIFAIGPAVRAALTERHRRRAIAERLGQLGRLQEKQNEVSASTESLRAARSQYQTAYESRNVERAKAAGKLALSALGGALVLVSGRPQELRFIKPIWENTKESFSDWNDVKLKINELSTLISEQDKYLSSLNYQINKIIDEGDGFLGTLINKSHEEAIYAINVRINQEMKFARFISRASLSFVGVVCFSYILDWAINGF